MCMAVTGLRVRGDVVTSESVQLHEYIKLIGRDLDRAIQTYRGLTLKRNDLIGQQRLAKAKISALRTLIVAEQRRRRKEGA